MTRDKLLIVGADHLARADVKTTLSDRGFAVDAVDGLPRAEQLVEEADYDVVIVDEEVSAGDGIDLFREISRKCDRLLGILCSESPTVTTVDRAIRAGMQHVVPKPVDPGELVRLVHELTSRTAEPFHQLFRDEEGIIKADRELPCEFCGQQTYWRHPVLRAYFCCQDCFMLYRQLQGS